MNWIAFSAALVVIPVSVFLGCLAAAGVARAAYLWVNAGEEVKAAIDAAVFIVVVVAGAVVAGLVLP